MSLARRPLRRRAARTSIRSCARSGALCSMVAWVHSVTAAAPQLATGRPTDVGFARLTCAMRAQGRRIASLPACAQAPTPLWARCVQARARQRGIARPARDRPGWPRCGRWTAALGWSQCRGPRSLLPLATARRALWPLHARSCRRHFLARLSPPTQLPMPPPLTFLQVPPQRQGGGLQVARASGPRASR